MLTQFINLLVCWLTTADTQPFYAEQDYRMSDYSHCVCHVPEFIGLVSPMAVFFRSPTAKEQVHSGRKLDWYHIPGWKREEAVGTVLSRSHRSQPRQVKILLMLPLELEWKRQVFLENDRTFKSYVVSLREGKASGKTVCLLTLKGDFTLSGSTAEDLSELVTMFLSGLSERSQYAVALRDVSSQGGTPQFTCRVIHFKFIPDS